MVDEPRENRFLASVLRDAAARGYEVRAVPERFAAVRRWRRVAWLGSGVSAFCVGAVLVEVVDPDWIGAVVAALGMAGCVVACGTGRRLRVAGRVLPERDLGDLFETVWKDRFLGFVDHEEGVIYAKRRHVERVRAMLEEGFG